MSSKGYDHKEVEPKWLEFWLDKNIFKTRISENNETFSIVLPPPNVTGELHMGHALSGTFQDILIRYHRMLGKDVLWQIGTDHAGIGTQIVVEKFLKASEGKTKYDLGRDEFIKKVQAWKEEYGGKIIQQMKQLGFSPDYDRCRYTMDEHYVKAVKNAFISYFNDGLIYRGKRITNWCPKCLTSLSDLEIDKQAGKKKLYQINYHFKHDPSRFVTVATTRPETMFGDTAVAINPADERFKDLIAQIKNGEELKVLIPFTAKEIPLLLDEHVKLDFGTGALKVTPAHDPNDYEIGQRHSLDQVVIMDEQGKMLVCDEVPAEFQGLDRYKARDTIVEALAENLKAVEEYEQEKDLHDRCNTEIEPYLSDQWYVSMKKLAQLALDDVLNENPKSKFIPERYVTIFRNWLENIQDWCVSRQIWWGHRIPVFYYEYKNESGETEIRCFVSESDELPSETPDGKVGEARVGKIWQDEDVLDTWFSSALWPFATMQDDEKIFEHFYPTSVLATAREIINLWVSRMMYSSEYFLKQEPFQDILIHPVVQTPDGKRMSKSKGNAIDPLELKELYGADASRMWYASVGVHGPQDVKFPGSQDKKTKKWSSDTVEQYRKFANKLFNAAKFVQLQLDDDFSPKPVKDWDFSLCSLADKWVLAKFNKMLKELEADFAAYDFSEVQSKIYDFIWFNFCDWYIEMSKTASSKTSQQILFYVLESSLKVLHPIMPFITEEIWHSLAKRGDESISNQSYPRFDSELDSLLSSKDDLDKVMADMDLVTEFISSLRNIRQSLAISWGENLNVYLKSEADLSAIAAGESFIKAIAKVESLDLNSQINEEELKPASITILADIKIIVPLAGLVDLDKVRQNLERKIEKLDKDMQGLEKRLSSENFIKNAAPEKVAETKSALGDLQNKKDLYQREMASL